MKIIFADNTELEVRSIMGGLSRIQNADRDMLSIEVDPSIANTEELRNLFIDKDKTTRIRTSVIEDDQELVSEVGEDYTIYISATNERREVRGEPGIIGPPEWEEVNIVKIAQLTYMEKLLEKLQQ